MKQSFEKIISTQEVKQFAKDLDLEKKQKLFEYLMQPNILPRFLKSFFDFQQLLVTFPENKTQLIDCTFLPEYLEKMVTIDSDIEKLCLWCPEGQKRLFEFIVNPSKSNPIALGPEYIKQYAHQFPAYQTYLYQYLILTAKKNMKSTYEVKLIVEAFPGCKDELFKLILKNKILEQIIKTPSDLKVLQGIFPHYSFLTHLSLDEDIFNNEAPETVKSWREKKYKEIKRGYLALANQPFARGSGMGFFCSLDLPIEMGGYVGSFLDEKAALQLARSSKSIFQTAEAELIASRKFTLQTEKEENNSPPTTPIHT